MTITLPAWVAYLLVFNLMITAAIFFTVAALGIGEWVEEKRINRALKKK